MSSPVHTLSRRTSLAVAFDTMASSEIRHLPVVDEDGRLCGLVTQRDLLRHALAQTSLYDQRAYLESIPVEDIMALTPQTIGPDDDVAMAARTMLMLKYGCLPVVEQGRLVGILTEADFVQLLV